jgi:hypothetical protein
MAFSVTLQGSDVEVITPEGGRASMPLPALLEQAAAGQVDTGSAALPRDVRYVSSIGPIKVWVAEVPPACWNLRWIKGGSDKRRPGRLSYRRVSIALPYLVVVAAFVPGPGGITLSDSNECFFRTAPLEHWRRDELLVPALLNCSLFATPHGRCPIGVEGRPVVWICTQYLDRSFQSETDADRRMLLGFQSLMSTLLSTGFNYSSEMHEFSSGFTQSRDVDARVATIEAWEQATQDDPEFTLQVPWLKTGYTVHDVVERVFQRLSAPRRQIRSASDVVRLVLHHHGRAKDNGKGRKE